MSFRSVTIDSNAVFSPVTVTGLRGIRKGQNLLHAPGFHGPDSPVIANINAGHRTRRNRLAEATSERPTSYLPRSILLLRHAQGEHNVANGPVSDPNELIRLTPFGRVQAQFAGTRFHRFKDLGVLPADWNPSGILFTGFQRTEETLAHFLPNSGLLENSAAVYSQVRELDEIDWGMEELLHWNNLPKQEKKLKSKKTPFYTRHMRGESPHMQHQRVKEVLRDQIFPEWAGQDVLFVGHERTNTHILAALFMQHWEQYRLFERGTRFANAGMIYLTHDDESGWQIQFIEGRIEQDLERKALGSGVFPEISAESIMKKFGTNPN